MFDDGENCEDGAIVEVKTIVFCDVETVSGVAFFF